MQSCPVCSKKFSLIQIEQHVNECLNNQDDFVMIDKSVLQNLFSLNPSESESLRTEQNTAFDEQEADRELALKILAEEELQRKSEEEANQKYVPEFRRLTRTRLLVQLLEKEKMDEIQRETYYCSNCKKQKQIQEMFYLDVQQTLPH